MDKELEEQLVKEYPEFFEYYDKEFEDEPAPQISLFGFECDDGWYQIIEGLCETISQLGVSLQVVQVKEKFGGLRFYYQEVEVDEERYAYMVHGAVQMAESMSFQNCEVCGNNGELRKDGGWLKTRCDDCYTEENSS